MPLQYSKPWLSLPEQLDLLKSRGLLVNDDNAATECLHRNGYYRLSAYWYPFREIIEGKRSDTFLPDSHFEDARNLYVFDNEFKLHLLDALERVEIAVRVEISLLLGKRDAFALSNPDIFHPRFVNQRDAKGETKYDKWTEKYEKSVANAKDEFVKHYERRYGARLPLPIWIAIELWDFGLLSNLYSGLRVGHQGAIANRFGVPEREIMESWLHSLNYARNVIAHHGRLWNLHLGIPPKLPGHEMMPQLEHLRNLPNANKRIYSVCCILCHFSRVINPQSSWPRHLVELVGAFPKMPYANIGAMGFHENWKDESLWKRNEPRA